MNKHYLLGALAFSATALAAHALPVTLTVDETFDGIANANHTPFSTGFLEIGWLTPGTTQSQIVGFFNSNNLAAIDSAFNTVFSLQIPAGITNVYAPGVFDTTVTLVPDNDSAALASYTSNVAGKAMYAWIRNTASLAATTQMAFVSGNASFPTAADTVNFTDFGGTFASDAGTPWIGLEASIANGDPIDINGGSPVDGLNFAGGPSVLQLVNTVPEPSSTLTVLVGLAALAGIRVRRA